MINHNVEQATNHEYIRYYIFYLRTFIVTCFFNFCNIIVDVFLVSKWR